MKHLQALWVYRYFIISTIKTEFYTRLARSRLGIAWVVIHPLAQVAMYAFVLSAVLSSKLPGIESRYAYAIYLMAGMSSWTLFLEVINRSLNVFIDNANLLKKMAFPKLTLPIVIAGSSLLSNLVLLVAILVVFGLLGHYPFYALTWLPLLILLNLSLALSFGLFLGILHVFIRDIGQLMPMLLQLWFWLTPIVYIADIIPEKFHFLLSLNPMHAVAIGYQAVLAYGKTPELATLLYPLALTILMATAAAWMYKKSHEEMADVL